MATFVVLDVAPVAVAKAAVTSGEADAFAADWTLESSALASASAATPAAPVGSVAAVRSNTSKNVIVCLKTGRGVACENGIT